MSARRQPAPAPPSCSRSGSVEHVIDVDHLFGRGEASRGGLRRCGARPVRAAVSRHRLRSAMKRDVPETAIFVERKLCRSRPRKCALRFPAWPRNTGSSSPGELVMTLQHLGGRRLLLQRLGEFASCAPAPRRTAARSRSRSPPDRRRWSTSSICLSLNGLTVRAGHSQHADRYPLAQ